MKCPFCIKKCTKCGGLLVAWKGNFCNKKGGKYKLNSICKKCNKKIREINREERIIKKRQWNKEHKEEISEYNKQYREEHKEYYQEYNKQYREEHKEEITEYKKQYREEHKEEISEKQKQWYEENREDVLKKRIEYYIENKEKIIKYQKQYRINNPHAQLNKVNKRRSKLESQGRGITKEQWYEMMCWFDWCCAYSGEYIGGKENKNRTIDHIIPISKGGEHEIWNLVPCFSNYNYSKHTKNIEEWYQQQEFYSEERLIKIYTWCEYAFNKWKPRRKGNKKRLKL